MMNRLGAFIAMVHLAVTGVSGQAAAGEVRFGAHPAAGRWVGSRNAPAIGDPDLKSFRTQILRASRQAPNFAGHYRLATWGCGSGCVSGALIDLNTGVATALPYWVCCYASEREDFQPIEFRLSSRMVVFNGKLSEEPPMASHVFVLERGRLKKIATVPNDGSFRTRNP